MKKHAVLITVLVALLVTLFSVSITFFEFYKLNKEQYVNSIFMKYQVITRVFREHFQKRSALTMLEANLAIYDLYLIPEGAKSNKIIAEAKVLKREGFQAVNEALIFNKEHIYKQKILHDMRASMLLDNGKIYFYIESKHVVLLLEDKALKGYYPWNLYTTYFSIIAGVLLAFFMILQRLRPLRRIQKQIRLLGSGNMDVSFKLSGHDEISIIANELEDTRKKIQIMMDSRTLFMRNLMHELKTPIAKGRIASAMLEKPKQQERFSNIFIRMEKMITEFALIEEVGTGFQYLEKKEYRLIDLIDEAIDIAMVDKESVDVDIALDSKVTVDYKIYTTAIKNMIDNAMKYSPDAQVRIVQNGQELCFENSGTKLAHPLSYYVQPFTKSHTAESSFGLGLYIVDSILKEHESVLAYEYHDGLNHFIFVPSSVSIDRS